MKILFFSPHAYFSVHSLPEALVAENLSYLGNEIIQIQCGGIYKKHCLCMSHVKYDDGAQKREICKSCRKIGSGISKDFGFRTLYLDDFISENERSLSNLYARSLSKESYINFELDNIPIGKFALYEFWLNHKLSDCIIADDLWEEYLASFENALATYFGMKRILLLETPDRVVTYNSLYSVNRVACALADGMSISHFTLHAGAHYLNRIQQMTIFKGIEASNLISLHPAVVEYQKKPCTSQELVEIGLHIKELFKASSPWVYSIKSKKMTLIELRERFCIKPNQKVLLAVMRSNDEISAAKLAGVNIYESSPIFSSQIEWMEWLANFASKNSDYVIIFRIHPREFPNKREGVSSQSAKFFLKYLEKFKGPTNFYVNLPSDNLSLHDLLKISDLVLNNTSSAGLEAALFGIPILGVGDKPIPFDPILQVESYTLNQYTKNIELLSRLGWSIQRVVYAFRWLNYLNSEVSIDISDGYKINHTPRLRLMRVGFRMARKVGNLMRFYQPFTEVKSRAVPLKNNCKLSYAILNDRESHIGVFKTPENEKKDSELLAIIGMYKNYMSEICAEGDRDFEQRYSQCINLIDD